VTSLRRLVGTDQGDYRERKVMKKTFQSRKIKKSCARGKRRGSRRPLQAYSLPCSDRGAANLYEKEKKKCCLRKALAMKKANSRVKERGPMTQSVAYCDSLHKQRWGIIECT